MAIIAAVVLLPVSNFLIAFLMWKLTVFTDMPMICPISQEDFPFAVHRIHSFSLGESVGVSSMSPVRRSSTVSAPRSRLQDVIVGKKLPGVRLRDFAPS